MTLLKYGEMRKMAFAPGFDLIVYGFSAAEANSVMKRLGYPNFERGQILSRLARLEKERRMPDGFKTSLTRDEVRQLVLSLPSILFERPPRAPAPLVSAITDDDRMELGDRARMLMDSAKSMSDHIRTLRATGREWEANPGRLLEKDLGLEFF
ncbi:MAG TPA: hypothetical protein VLD37_00705 [Candidatus Bilamarchaeum sp.]|nr:hypothetical protein [Candidatus Bilamarchaeum sp.]